MTTVKVTIVALLLLALLARPGKAEEPPARSPVPYQPWSHSGSIFILTTPEGANVQAAASEDGFPLLVRLHKDCFNFSQAKAGGEDIRFSSSAGAPLPSQAEEWDAANGTASISIKIVDSPVKAEVLVTVGPSAK